MTEPTAAEAAMHGALHRMALNCDPDEGTCEEMHGIDSHDLLDNLAAHGWHLTRNPSADTLDLASAEAEQAASEAAFEIAGMMAVGRPTTPQVQKAILAALRSQPVEAGK